MYPIYSEQLIGPVYLASCLSIIRCFEQHREIFSIIYSCTLFLCLVWTQHYGQITQGGIPTCLLNHSKLIIPIPEKRSIKSKKHSIGSSDLLEGILSQSNSFRINYLGFSSSSGEGPGDIIRTGPQWFYLLAHLHKSIKTCQKRQLFVVTHSVSADGDDKSIKILFVYISVFPFNTLLENLPRDHEGDISSILDFPCKWINIF